MDECRRRPALVMGWSRRVVIMLVVAIPNPESYFCLCIAACFVHKRYPWHSVLYFRSQTLSNPYRQCLHPRKPANHDLTRPRQPTPPSLASKP